jgi:hypothetical protein
MVHSKKLFKNNKTKQREGFKLEQKWGNMRKISARKFNLLKQLEVHIVFNIKIRKLFEHVKAGAT